MSFENIFNDIMGCKISENKADDMIIDDDNIYDHKESLRARMNLQVQASDVKSTLIDKLRAEYSVDPNLHTEMAALETTSPRIYQYIKKLELVNVSIWCTNCETIKYVPGVYSPPYDKSSYANLEKQLALLAAHVKELQVSVQNSEAVLESEVATLKKQYSDTYDLKNLDDIIDKKIEMSTINTILGSDI